MASSCMMMSTSAATCLSAGSTPSALRGAACPTSSGSARLMQVMITRCSSNNKDSGSSSLQEAVDRGTKQELSRADIERHQAEAATSEKQSMARPELERRPETGDRSLVSLLAFDGAAPETINGRMAMVGFVWALVAEKMTGLTVVEQLFNPATSGALLFATVVPLFTLASIIPFVNGESTDSRAWGPFTAKAERWNGRLAMIGFVSLLIVQTILHGPLIY